MFMFPSIGVEMLNFLGIYLIKRSLPTMGALANVPLSFWIFKIALLNIVNMHARTTELIVIVQQFYDKTRNNLIRLRRYEIQC